MKKMTYEYQSISKFTGNYIVIIRIEYLLCELILIFKQFIFCSHDCYFFKKNVEKLFTYKE